MEGDIISEKTSRMSNKHILWIGIDPNILLQGFYTTALFKCENYLKFKVNSETQKETVGGSIKILKT